MGKGWHYQQELTFFTFEPVEYVKRKNRQKLSFLHLHIKYSILVPWHSLHKQLTQISHHWIFHTGRLGRIWYGQTYHSLCCFLACTVQDEIYLKTRVFSLGEYYSCRAAAVAAVSGVSTLGFKNLLMEWILYVRTLLAFKWKTKCYNLCCFITCTYMGP